MCGLQLSGLLRITEWGFVKQTFLLILNCTTVLSSDLMGSLVLPELGQWGGVHEGGPATPSAGRWLGGSQNESLLELARIQKAQNSMDVEKEMLN